MATAPPAGWYTDPADRDRYRYWTGEQWTGHVRDRVIDPTPAGTAAAPGDDAPPIAGGRRPRLPVLVAVVALVAIAATAGVVAYVDRAPTGAGGNTLTGDVRVGLGPADPAADRAFGPDGTPCQTGTGPGIGAGSTVTVRNARGEELGRAALEGGRVDRTPNSTTCVFDYTIPAVPGAELYTVRVADRPARRVTRAQVERAGWRIDLHVR